MQGTKEPNPVLQDEADNIEETIEMEEMEEAVGAEQPGERHELILVAVSDSPNCPRVIRAAVRLAHQLDAPVKAVYVEQRRIEELGETERHHITESIQLLRSFGIEILFAYGTDIVAQITETANVTGATKLFIGLSGKRLSFRNKDIGTQIRKRIPSLDVYIIPGSIAEPWEKNGELNEAIRSGTYKEKSAFQLLLALVGVMALSTAVALFAQHLGLPYVDMVIIYLFGVLVLSTIDGNLIFLGASSLSAVMLVNYFFVDPRFSFRFKEQMDLLTFVLMFLLSFTLSYLMGRFRRVTEKHHKASLRMDMLFDCSTALLLARNKRDVDRIIAEHFIRLLHMSVVIYRKKGDGSIGRPAWYPKPGVSESQLLPLDNETDRAAVQTVFETGRRAGFGTDQNTGARALYLPIKNESEIYAAVGIYQTEEQDIPAFEFGILSSILNEAGLVYSRLSGTQKGTDSGQTPMS